MTDDHRSETTAVISCSSESDYWKVLESAGSRLVVVDCCASWCPPCKHIAPVLEALAREHPDIVFVKVDVDQVPSIKTILSVWVLPTFFFLKDGHKLGSISGAKESALRNAIANGGNVGMCSSCSIQ